MAPLNAAADLDGTGPAAKLPKREVNSSALLERKHGGHVVPDGQEPAAVEAHIGRREPEREDRDAALEQVDRL